MDLLPALNPTRLHRRALCGTIEVGESVHRNIIIIAPFIFIFTGCTAEWVIPEGYIVECTDNSDCPDTAECTLSDDGQSRICVTAGETLCGNGVREVGEECDDGNLISTDGCINCVAATCGDGLLWEGTEACDSGSNNSDTEVDACRTTCVLAYCGDGVQDSGEACDNGPNNSDAYGATDTCNLTCSGAGPHCGDGVVNGGEVCDDGTENTDLYGEPFRCAMNCSGYAPSCGDGFVDIGEFCDDGVGNTDAYGVAGRCNLNCNGNAAYCGDGLLNGGESCDEGAENTDAYGIAGRCNLACNGDAPHCGDGLQNGGELCDLGLANSDVYGAPNGCQSNCAGPPAYCGDGITNGLEVCDDGPLNADGYQLERVCNSSCNGYSSYCGDGVVNAQAGEVCDVGAAGNVGGCSATCQRDPETTCGDGNLDWALEDCDNAGIAPVACSYNEVPCLRCNDACDIVDGDDAQWCGDGVVQDFEICDTAATPETCAACIPGDMALVDGDSFLSTQGMVTVAAFSMDVYEVTAGDYKGCVLDGVCDAVACTYSSHQTYGNLSYVDLPINCVTRDEARTYCEWKGKRLPTDAEWELAGGMADGRLFPWGNVPGINKCGGATCATAQMVQECTSLTAGWRGCSVACDPDNPEHRVYAVTGNGCSGSGCTSYMGYCSRFPYSANAYNVSGFFAPVGGRPWGASPAGIEDMIGNVAEWTEDGGPRGGGPNYFRQSADAGTIPYLLATQVNTGWEDHDYGVGFRCAK